MGALSAAEAMLAYEGGAFPGAIVGAGGLCLLAPYKIDNFVIDMYDVVVNKPKNSEPTVLLEHQIPNTPPKR